MKALLILASGLLAIGLPSSASGGPEGVPVDDIAAICSAGSRPADRRSEAQLVNGMERLYGRKLEVRREAPKTGAVIFLGKEAALRAGMVTEEELRAVHRGGHVIRVRDGRIAIAGPDGYATGFGVTAFLERLGLHTYSGVWPLRGRRVQVVEPKGRVIGPMDIRSKPFMPFRFGWSRPEVADSKAALEAWHPELKGKTDSHLDHSAGFFLPKDVYYDEHPEYYALLANGKRIAKDVFSYHRTPLCLSNPDVIRISIERGLKWVKLHSDKTYFHVTYGDTSTWCQCEACRKLDPEPGAYATRNLTWVNAVARAIGEKHPDKIILTYAYAGSDKAPPKIRPAKNVWVICTSALGNLPFLDHERAVGTENWRRRVGKIDGWVKIAPGQVGVCEYLGRYEPSTVDTTAAKFRAYAERGVVAHWHTYGWPKNFAPLVRYLYPRLCWDPKQDAQALAEDFARHYYGPAGEAVVEHLRLAHRRYQETRANPGQMKDGYPDGYYARPFADKMLATLRKACEAAKNDKGLYEELRAEARAFLCDWMAHPLSKELTPEAAETLRDQLATLRSFTGNGEKELIAFARQVHATGCGIESVQQGALRLVEDWLEKQDLPSPKAVKLANGVRIPAEAFMYGVLVRERGGHVGPPLPPRMATCIYVRGNRKNRSHRTEAQFELGAIPGDGAAELVMDGQDSDHRVPAAEIRVSVNDTKIYEGPVMFVKWNWSRQSFAIPAGVLRKGVNKLEIVNVGDPKSIKEWWERWVEIAQATIRFRSADKNR